MTTGSLSPHLQLFWWVISRLGSSRQPRAVAYGVWVCITTCLIIIILKCNVSVHLGAGPGPPDPQVDAGPGELGLALSLHHAARGVQAEDAGGRHLAPVDPAALLETDQCRS